MKPTDEGLKRYPPDGVYREAKDVGPVNCKCGATCRTPCIGECGCLACALRYCREQNDRLADEG